jgi:hypothetical protein
MPYLVHEVSTKQRLRGKKRKYRMKRKDYVKHRKRRKINGFGISVKTNAIAKSQKHGAYAHVVRRANYAPAPTVTETGSSFGVGVIENSMMKTTPNGSGSFGWTFNLQQLNGYTDFTSIYKFYKILWVKLTFYPRQNAWQSGRTDAGNVTYDNTGGIKSTSPELIVVPDRTSAANVTGTSALMSHEEARFHIFNDGKEFSVFLQPTILGIEGSTASTYNVPGKPTWIPTTTTNAPHYGLRCRISSMSDYDSIRVIMEMKVAFKEPKA